MSGAHGLELKINLKILVTISSPLSILYPLLLLWTYPFLEGLEKGPSWMYINKSYKSFLI